MNNLNGCNANVQRSQKLGSIYQVQMVTDIEASIMGEWANLDKQGNIKSDLLKNTLSWPKT